MACQKKEFEEEFQFLCSFYGDDFQQELLRAQLLTLGIDFQHAYKEAYNTQAQVTSFDVRDCFRSLSVGQQDLLSQPCRVLQLVLVMPGTNANSEHSFSALHRLKSHLRSSMTQQRLNNLMILHVHKECTDSLNPVKIANEFVGEAEHRLTIFGKF